MTTVGSRLWANMENATAIHAPRLDLVLLSGALLDALLADELPRARQLATFDFPDGFVREDAWVKVRRNQVLADATWEPWSLRAIVLRSEQRMVGSTAFHGPPGINSLEAPGALEVGYTVFPEFRRRGYATETCRAMLDWAHREHRVRHFISSIEPSNAASLRVIEKLGFASMDLLMEGEAIFQLQIPS